MTPNTAVLWPPPRDMSLHLVATLATSAMLMLPLLAGTLYDAMLHVLLFKRTSLVKVDADTAITPGCRLGRHAGSGSDRVGHEGPDRGGTRVTGIAVVRRNYERSR